jgi:hypothetical protein
MKDWSSITTKPWTRDKCKRVLFQMLPTNLQMRRRLLFIREELNNLYNIITLYLNNLLDLCSKK